MSLISLSVITFPTTGLKVPLPTLYCTSAAAGRRSFTHGAGPGAGAGAGAGPAAAGAGPGAGAGPAGAASGTNTGDVSGAGPSAGAGASDVGGIGAGPGTACASLRLCAERPADSPAKLLCTPAKRRWRLASVGMQSAFKHASAWGSAATTLSTGATSSAISASTITLSALLPLETCPALVHAAGMLVLPFGKKFNERSGHAAWADTTAEGKGDSVKLRVREGMQNLGHYANRCCGFFPVCSGKKLLFTQPQHIFMLHFMLFRGISCTL